MQGSGPPDHLSARAAAAHQISRPEKCCGSGWFSRLRLPYDRGLIGGVPFPCALESPRRSVRACSHPPWPSGPAPKAAAGWGRAVSSTARRRRAARSPLAAAPPARETALDRYVKAPDPAFRFSVVATRPGEGHTAYLLEMVSQRWLTTAEVDKPEWRHWLTIIKPDTVAHPTALLLVAGGDSKRKAPDKTDAGLLDIAMTTRSVVAELRMVPNQPLVFANDGGRERSEDEIIAYTWDKFLRTGDERWPARLPMTKAVVRAMDAVTAFCAQPGGRRPRRDRRSRSSSPAPPSAAGPRGRRRRSIAASSRWCRSSSTC